ncbi:endolytic transglycosylase MltG [Patescibacteria group bacterium]|nr:endolytic transglycosylase MltG [Patescibacteria group bacterium]
MFLNRIAQGMLLGADVTLCYGLQVTYDKCTPSFIVDHLVDTNNPYNTRKV